jgi:Eph receptor B1
VSRVHDSIKISQVLENARFVFRVMAITNKDVELVWDKPLHSDSPIEYYEVRWFPKTELDTLNNMTLSTKDLKAHISDLLENTEYGFQVRCKTLNGYGTYSNIVYAQTLQNVSLGNGFLSISRFEIVTYNLFNFSA